MKILPLAALGLAAALAGCASQPSQTATSNNAQLQQQLSQARSQQSQLESQNTQLKQQLSANQKQLAEANQQGKTQSPGNGIDLVPPNAKPGECFARVLTPAKFETKSQRMLKSAASERIVTTPARFKWVTKRILVQPASTKVVAVPATYKTVHKRIMVQPSYTMWKRGHGAIERRDANGDIMCLVTVPAKYETVSTRVINHAAATKTINIPAVYKTIKVREVAQEAGSKTIQIPAVYRTVSHTEQVQAPQMIWTRVVCETNATPDLIRKVQVALKKSGHNPGPIDGILGPLTLRGARSYEKAKGLALSNAGVITYETLKSLGVDTP